MMSESNSSQDQKLLNTITRTVLSNLKNEQFGVEDLSRQVGMSRSNLHRKLKLLKGQSVSQFIREVRLQQAHKLLQQDATSTSEIAYQVGFNSISYFHKCFNSYYGYSPGKLKNAPGEYPNGISERYQPIETVAKKEEKTITRQNNDSKIVILSQIFARILFLPLLLVVILGIGYYFITHQEGNELPTARSIAVLPFDDLTNISELHYLADGIQDELISEMGNFSVFRVISKTSTRRFAERQWSAPEIYQELGVDLIVDGLIMAYGDSLKVQIQLIALFPEERIIFTKEYYKNIDQAFALQKEVIRDIIKSLQINPLPNVEKKLSQATSVDPENYKLYLKGLYFLNKSTPEEFQRGLKYLHQAIEINPANPKAYVKLANGYITLGHGPDPPEYAWKRGKAAVLQAIMLDSTIAEAYSALGSIKLYFEWDWEGAEKAFRRANELNPSLAFNRFHYAWYLAMMGRMEEAFREHMLAKELAPLTPIVSADMGSLYSWVGKYDQALNEVKQALELDSEHGHTWWVLGNIHALLGEYDKALEAHKKAAEINMSWKWALGNTYALAGKQEQALSIANQIKENEITSRQAFGLAMIYASLGNMDEAFHWLEYGPSNYWIPWLRTWPGVEPLRSDPRFYELLEKANLPPLPI